MYTLYWHPYSSSYAPMAVLEELGVDFDLYEVDYDGGENLRSDYRRLQPLGLIPALKIGDNRSMFESGAIILYLCDRHTEAKLAPTTDASDRHAYLQWMLFLADTIYPSYNRYYHPERYTASAEGASDVKAQAQSNALAQWQVIEDSLTDNGPWLLGNRFSACDIYLQMMTTWHETAVDLFESFPRIGELARGVSMRDRCRRAIERHNFATGFEP
jgi:glutathione S-transferase